jgi:uncharacterized protein (DUF427 family)
VKLFYGKEKMTKAIWNNQVVAESDNIIKLEGNAYFPPDSIKQEFFVKNENHSVCPWKGTASYYDIVVDGKTNPSAAWYYPDPKEAAKEIRGFVAFWKGVTLSN